MGEEGICTFYSKNPSNITRSDGDMDLGDQIVAVALFTTGCDMYDSEYLRLVHTADIY